MKKVLFNKGSSPRNVVGDLPHIKSFIHKESSLFNKAKSAGDCRVLRTATSAMTTSFNEKAFTLIELLVVVLIIGILSAIALPQYNKAVEKSRMTEAIVAIEAIAQANQRYKLANGAFTREITDLDVDFPVEDCNYDALSAKCSKYFKFAASNSSGNQVYIAIAQRNPDGKKYYLNVYSNGRKACGFYNSASNYEKQLCQQFNAQ